MYSPQPLLSISCVTYNHANYIRQALDGFLMQKTNFLFEIIIHDDASTDGTREIIEEYQSRYPELIFPMFQEENQYSKGIRGIGFRYNYPRCRGKYIALCEGDDYWTDPDKLQKQVDFLEKNEDYIVCSHNAMIYNEMDNSHFEFHNWSNAKPISKSEIIETGGSIFPTAALVFRNTIDYKRLLRHSYCSAGDFVLIMELIKHGNLYFINEFMSCYRMHPGGVYTSLAGRNDKLIDFEKRVITFLETSEVEFPLEYKPNFKRAIKKRYLRIFNNNKYPIYHVMKLWRYFTYSEMYQLIHKKFFTGKNIVKPT